MDLNSEDLLKSQGLKRGVFYLIMPSIFISTGLLTVSHINHYPSPIYVQAQGPGLHPVPPKPTPTLRPRSGALHQELCPVAGAHTDRL